MITFKPYGPMPDGRYLVTDPSGSDAQRTGSGALLRFPDYDAALRCAERTNDAQRTVESFWSTFRTQNPEIPWRTVNGRARV